MTYGTTHGALRQEYGARLCLTRGTPLAVHYLELRLAAHAPVAAGALRGEKRVPHPCQDVQAALQQQQRPEKLRTSHTEPPLDMLLAVAAATQRWS
jgi:hypothetical protein